MDYFVYLSDAKIEMLFEQIRPRFRGRLGGEVEFNLGVFRAKFSTQSVERTRYEKLRIIKDYLGDKVGTADHPKEYFSGTLEMAWGPYEDYEEMVYFSGVADETFVGLGGTAANCLPAHGATPSTTTSYSLSSRLVTALIRKRELVLPRYGLGRDYRTPEVNDRALAAVAEATLRQSAPRQRLTFLAKTVLFGHEVRFGRNAVLGTPLYVALAKDT